VPFTVHTFTVVVNNRYESEPFTAHGSAGATYVGVCGSYVDNITLTCFSDADFAIGEFAVVAPDVYGACCDEWAGTCADDVGVSDCISVPHWRFSAFATCDELEPPCGEVRGACCYASECVYQRPMECADGGSTYKGDGVPCDPNPCLCADF